MLIATQKKLTIATTDCARERSLRIQKQKLLESSESDYNILKIRLNELVNRLAMVADLEKNGKRLIFILIKFIFLFISQYIITT